MVSVRETVCHSATGRGPGAAAESQIKSFLSRHHRNATAWANARHDFATVANKPNVIEKGYILPSSKGKLVNIFIKHRNLVCFVKPQTIIANVSHKSSTTLTGRRASPGCVSGGNCIFNIVLNLEKLKQLVLTFTREISLAPSGVGFTLV